MALMNYAWPLQVSQPQTPYFGWATENYGTQPTRLLIGWSHQSTQKTAPDTISHETAYDSC